MKDSHECKVCAHCKATKGRSEFTKDRGRKDGLNPYCRSCTRARNRDAYNRNREGESARKAKYYLENKDKVLERNRKWRAANKPRYQARCRQYHYENPHVAVAGRYRRRVRMERAAVVDFTDEQLADRIAYYGGSCWMCGGPYEHLDHVKPVAKGGPHMLSNLRPACGPCNLSKSDSWPWNAAQ